MAIDTGQAGNSDQQLLPSLTAALRARFGDGVRGILMYGSCLRSGDPADGLVDLYVVVDDYRVYRRRGRALANRLLCPNVFYLETETAAGRVRCKYGVVATRDLERATSSAFESYFWGRLAQPVAILYARGPEDRRFLETALERAADTFMARVLPVLPARGRLEDLWTKGLAISYATELRAEGTARSRELVRADRDFFVAVTRDWARRHPASLRLEQRQGEWFYETSLSPARRRRGRIAWGLRRPWGKLLSLARLTKGLYTFDGGLDYIAWKLERHSGQRIEIPDKVRRRPLLHIWGLAWRLHRRGVFR